ncbi:MAG: hypothetical protein ACYDBQ_08580 [Thermoplasmatota archaeon]
MMLDVRTLPRLLLANAARILSEPDAIQQLDPDHFTVAGLRNHDHRLRVYRSGTRWRCHSDRRSDQDDPCAHILAVLDFRGAAELPTTFARKTAAARQSEHEEQARQLLPTRLPELLAQLLEANPAAEPAYAGHGRPPKSVYPQAFQAVMRAAFGHSVRSSHQAATDRRHNPYGSVSRSTLTRYLADEAHADYLNRLAEATLDPARGLEATGQRFGIQFATHSGALDVVVEISPRFALAANPTFRPGPAPPPLPGLLGSRRLELGTGNPTAQRAEVVCHLIGHNLGRLIRLELEHGPVRFQRAAPIGTAPVPGVVPAIV